MVAVDLRTVDTALGYCIKKIVGAIENEAVYLAKCLWVGKCLYEL